MQELQKTMEEGDDTIELKLLQIKKKHPILYKILFFEFFRNTCKYFLNEYSSYLFFQVDDIEEEINVLIKNRTWQMKMLYLTCVNRSYLFNYCFNNFEAWKNGAVEIDCYDYLRNGLSCREIAIFNQYFSHITTTKEAKTIYNSLYEIFRNANLKPWLTKTNVLISINHDLPLWIRTPFESKMNTASIIAQHDEKKHFADNYLNNTFSFVQSDGKWIKR